MIVLKDGNESCLFLTLIDLLLHFYEKDSQIFYLIDAHFCIVCTLTNISVAKYINVHKNI